MTKKSQMLFEDSTQISQEQEKQSRKEFLKQSPLLIKKSPRQKKIININTIKIRKVNFKNCIIPKRETFPHDEAFGRWAWCFTSLERALAKFELIENN